MSDPLARTPGSLLAAYLAPYFVYVALGAVAELPRDALWVYAARAVAVTGALAWFWRSYRPLRGARPVAGSVALGAVAGLAGTALWVGLARAVSRREARHGLARRRRGRRAPRSRRRCRRSSRSSCSAATRCRSCSCGSGRARRRAPHRSATRSIARGSADVAPGAWSLLAVALSSALFAAGHHPAEWLAALRLRRADVRALDRARRPRIMHLRSRDDERGSSRSGCARAGAWMDW